MKKKNDIETVTVNCSKCGKHLNKKQLDNYMHKCSFIKRIFYTETTSVTLLLVMWIVVLSLTVSSWFSVLLIFIYVFDVYIVRKLFRGKIK